MDSKPNELSSYKDAASLALTVFEALEKDNHQILHAVDTTYTVEELYAAALSGMTLAMDTIVGVTGLTRLQVVNALRMSLAESGSDE